jgi:tricorn protease
MILPLAQRRKQSGLCLKHLFTLIVLLACASRVFAATEGYYRAPAVHADAVVFVSEGDLWKVNLTGGVATRLTAHPASERLPHFSPDGRWIAFTGDYASAGDVYLIPSEGGEPKQLTFHPAEDEVAGFTPDSKFVLFTSHRSGLRSEQWLYKVSIEGGESEQLPIGRASLASFNSDGTKIAFNRHDWQANWKRYKGGTAPDVWVADLGNKTFNRIIGNEAVNSDPMWVGDRIYFLSERSGLANIYSCKPDGSNLQQHTHHDDYDCRFASTDGKTIVYSCGADLFAYDIATAKDAKINITIASDRIRQLPQTADPAQTLESYSLSKDGSQITVASRGDLWLTRGKKESRFAPIDTSAKSRERNVAMSPDGKKIAAISDSTGEQEIVILDTAGKEKPKTITDKKQGWLFPPTWSPDNEQIAYADLTGTLYLVEVEDGEATVVDQDKNWELTEYAFSPDGKWLAYTKTNENHLRSIHLYNIENESKTTISQGFTNDYSPAWSLDGKYLFFLSDRSVNPILDSFDRAFICKTTTKVCCTILAKEGKSPLLPEELLEEKEKKDESTTKPSTTQSTTDASSDASPATSQASTAPATTQSDEDSDDESKELPKVTIDLEGIESRIVELPVSPGMYFNLRSAKDNRLYFMSMPLQGMADEEHGEATKSVLMTFDLKEKKENGFVDGIEQYDLSMDGSKVAFAKNGVIVIADIGESAPEKPTETVTLSAIPLRVNLRDEWGQIFVESWRLMRDFYWAQNMAGVDWPAMRKKYEPLVSRVGTRGELNDLVGQMIGELGTSHSYIWGGDTNFDPPPAPIVGTLGADIDFDPAAKLHRFKKVLRPPAWETSVEAPLTRNDVNVKDGEYLIAINGHEVAPDESVDQLLLNLAGQQVQLTIASKPDKSDTREVQVKVLADDHEVRYRDWFRRNLEYVQKKSDGKIGYMHLPDMGGPGLIEFVKGFYPQIKRDALVIDVRDNGGGFVSQMMIERLNRKVWAYDRPRRGLGSTYPEYTHVGYKAVIINEHAGSDGDIFPYSFRTLGIGPLIGKRTWGGVVGIRTDKPFVDQGMMSQPEFAWWDKNGWSIENRGVDPDIEVDYRPQDYVDGVDPQLDRAIDELLKKLKEKPIEQPQPPAEPDKSGRK